MHHIHPLTFLVGLRPATEMDSIEMAAEVQSILLYHKVQ